MIVYQIGVEILFTILLWANFLIYQLITQMQLLLKKIISAHNAIDQSMN